MDQIAPAGVRNIIFDLDGTLIDSSPGVIEATNYALTRLGQKTRSAAEIIPFIGHPLEEMFAAFCAAPIAVLSAAFQERAVTAVVGSARALPGVIALLPRFHAAGYRLAIATTKYAVHTEGIVKKLGWTAYFSALASGDEVAHVKPAPDIIELALRRLGAKRTETVVVGDTVNDIMAARSAGVMVIAIKSPFGNGDLAASGPNMVLENFAELERIFHI